MAFWQFLVRYGVERQDEFVVAVARNGVVVHSEAGE
jgi:hypothetical protein